MNDFEQYLEADCFYENGDYFKAFSIFLGLAERGDTSAMLRVANMYSCSKGVEFNIEKALEWEKRAANAGDDLAFLNLAITYRNNGEYKKAKHWLEKAISANNGDAALELAKMYMISDRERANIRKYLSIAIESDFSTEETKECASKLLKTLF